MNKQKRGGRIFIFVIALSLGVFLCMKAGAQERVRIAYSSG